LENRKLVRSNKEKRRILGWKLGKHTNLIGTWISSYSYLVEAALEAKVKQLSGQNI